MNWLFLLYMVGVVLMGAGTLLEARDVQLTALDLTLKAMWCVIWPFALLAVVAVVALIVLDPRFNRSFCVDDEVTVDT